MWHCSPVCVDGLTVWWCAVAPLKERYNRGIQKRDSIDARRWHGIARADIEQDDALSALFLPCKSAYLKDNDKTTQHCLFYFKWHFVSSKSQASSSSSIPTFFSLPHLFSFPFCPSTFPLSLCRPLLPPRHYGGIVSYTLSQPARSPSLPFARSARMLL